MVFSRRDGLSRVARRSASLASLLLIAACTSSPGPAPGSSPQGDWRGFKGSWSASGLRRTLTLAPGQQSSVFDLTGSVLLTGERRPAAGFQARVIGFTGDGGAMQGRSVWTDERGDQVFSELQGEGTATGNRIAGTIVGGTGRFAGATGDYAFSWRFVLEAEDGTVQGQSVGLTGRVRAGGPAAAPGAAEGRP
jgi:hypothetical protein